MFYISDIQRRSTGLAFEEELDLKEDLRGRNPEILDLSQVVVKGSIRYETGLFVLHYRMAYTITLSSSRSMLPVAMEQEHEVTELFIKDSDLPTFNEQVEEDLLLVVEGDQINLADSVADNILLHIPLKVLSAEEELGTAFPEGKDWQVMTEEEYAQAQAAKKEANSPFADLAGLFDSEE